jgi:hypothetical protein
MPTVLFPVAEPPKVPTVEAVPALTTQPEYVYLLRVVETMQAAYPNAKIPTVLLPAAAPALEAAVAAPPAPTAHPEYVYLFRVVTAPPAVLPNAKIANVPSVSGHRP